MHCSGEKVPGVHSIQRQSIDHRSVLFNHRSETDGNFQVNYSRNTVVLINKIFFIICWSLSTNTQIPKPQIVRKYRASLILYLVIFLFEQQHLIDWLLVMWSRVFTIASVLIIIASVSMNLVHSMVPPTVHYHHGPDVPGGEHLLCRHPKEFEPLRKHIDLDSQQRNGLRCDLKHYSQIQRPCDFRRVSRFSLVTITVPMDYVSHAACRSRGFPVASVFRCNWHIMTFSKIIVFFSFLF